MQNGHFNSFSKHEIRTLVRKDNNQWTVWLANILFRRFQQGECLRHCEMSW